MAISGAVVAADCGDQCGGSPTKWFMRELPGHGVSWKTSAATSAIPLVRPSDEAGEDSTVGLMSLSGDFESE